MEKQKNITVADIAREVGLSKSAVAKVLLNNRSTIRVSQKNIERIKQVAEKMHYRPNTVARSLRSGKTGILGLVLGGLQSPYFAEFAELAVEMADKHEFQLIVCPVVWGIEREKAALDSLISSRVDGILLKTSIFSVRPELESFYAKYGIPIVIGQNQGAQFSCSLAEDSLPGMKMFLSALRKHGINELGMAVNEHGQERIPSHLSYCKDFEIKPHFFRFKAYNNDSLDECADAIVKSGCKHLLVCSDHYAIKLASRLGCRGKRIPDDISIASIGGTSAASYYNPPLTVIDQDIRKQVELLMEMLLDKINGNKEINHKSVPSRLIVRESFPLY